MDNAYWAFFVASLQAQQRFSSAEAATRGFMALKYMDADVVLDGGIGGGMPVKTMYMLNTKYIFYRPHKDRNMVSLNPSKRYSVNQDAEVQILAWAGNLTMSGRQFQGKMFE
jgi:orotate phosphoribosyltransferase-like protein